MTTTLEVAMTDPALPIDTILPVSAATIPAEIRAFAGEATSRVHGWGELWGPASSQGGCSFGCKVYVRRQGATYRYAVLHSSAYGHSWAPNAR